MVLTLRCVCTDLRTNSNFAFHIIKCLVFFITEVEGVYCAAHNYSLYKTDYLLS